MNKRNKSLQGHEKQQDQSWHTALAAIHELLLKVHAKLERKEGRKALRLSDVKSKTGDSKSQIYARLNTKYPAFDPSFPKPFYIGSSPRWWQHQIEDWLDEQDSSSRKTH